MKNKKFNTENKSINLGLLKNIQQIKKKLTNQSNQLPLLKNVFNPIKNSN